MNRFNTSPHSLDKSATETGSAGDLEAMERGFAEFQPAIDAIYQQIEAAGDSQAIDSFVGAGTQANVYKIVIGGKEYVARMPKYPEDNSSGDWAKKYGRGMLAARGVPGLEQGVAVSHEQGVVISEYMPGASLDKATAEEMGKVTPEQMINLVETVRATEYLSLRLDTHASNFLYDAEAGFGLIDLESEEGGYHVGLAGRLEQVAKALSEIGDVEWYDNSQDRTSEAYYAERGEILEARIQTLGLFGNALQQAPMDGGERDHILASVKQMMDRLNHMKDKETDPAYIQQAIAAEQARIDALPVVDPAVQRAGEANGWAPPPSPMF